jgi:putative endonuclease
VPSRSDAKYAESARPVALISLSHGDRAVSTGSIPAIDGQMEPSSKRFVYVLRSDRDQGRHYVGLTANVPKRLQCHNARQSLHTARNRPWRLLVSLEFMDEQAATRFEKYLKSGSGRAFAKRHFS